MHKIVVTGEKNLVKRLSARIVQIDIQVVQLPTIELVPLPLAKRSRATLENFANFDYVIFTSSHAVDFFCKEVKVRKGRKIAATIIAVGPATALTCKKHGLKVRLVATKFNALEMSKAFSIKKGTRILLPRSAIASNEYIHNLRKRDAIVISIPLYTTRNAKIPPLFQKLPKPDFIIFMSASSVKSFSKQMRGMLRVPVIVIGEQTAKACRDAGFSQIILAEEATTTGIVKKLRTLL